MARSEPIADASLPAIRARSRPGIAIAAMMPMIATTISSSINVKPLALRIFISDSSNESLTRLYVSSVGLLNRRDGAGRRQWQGQRGVRRVLENRGALV